MTVLIADDDKSILTALKLLLDGEGIECVACSTPKEVVQKIQQRSFQLALIDLNYHQDTTSGKEGLELVSSIRDIDSHLPIIVMTGWGTVDIAVEAMKRGAMDFVEKPWDNNNRLVSAIRTQIKLSEISQRESKLIVENKILKQEKNDSSNLIANSAPMKKLMSMVDKVAVSDISILITGENGTGKSLLASVIHERSHRSNGPFIAVNMGGISGTIFESEMFGHVKGAFTDAKSDRIGRVELADKGTLFMDEIANMPLDQQAKILRLLEECRYERLGSSQVKQASVRIISATNADLDNLIAAQNFRKDLLYRLNSITLHLPSLRERREDILPLAKGFLNRALARYESKVRGFSDAATTQLLSYAWPGNVRELQHVIDRAVLLSDAVKIGAEDLNLPKMSENAVALDEGLLQMDLEQAQNWYIQKMLDKCEGNASQAAKSLGISRSALYRRLGKSSA